MDIVSTPPSEFKIGFTASTGSQNQRQIIRNLVITLPNSAFAGTDVEEACQGIEIAFNPLENDYAYNGTIESATSSTNFIDKSSVQFYTNATDATPVTFVDGSYTNSQGTWTYDSATGNMSFISALGFYGTAHLFYNVKGTVAPVNQEKYRSGKGEIRVLVDQNCCVKPATSGTPLSTPIGISSVEIKEEGWPQNQPNGFVSLQSNEKGFVITRVNNAQNDIAQPINGMFVYDTGDSCFKLYTTENGWKCIERGCNN